MYFLQDIFSSYDQQKQQPTAIRNILFIVNALNKTFEQITRDNFLSDVR